MEVVSNMRFLNVYSWTITNATSALSGGIPAAIVAPCSSPSRDVGTIILSCIPLGQQAKLKLYRAWSAVVFKNQQRSNSTSRKVVELTKAEKLSRRGKNIVTGLTLTNIPVKSTSKESKKKRRCRKKKKEKPVAFKKDIAQVEKTMLYR